MNKNEVIAVCGGQWGDEGKGKIVDYLAQDMDVVIRAQGGDNAGHTVVNDQGKFALHLVPAGIFNPGTLNIIGAGVALNPQSLMDEIEKLRNRGLDLNNLKISPKAHLVFDYHQKLDGIQEVLKGSGKIGTTGQGIGPAYMDKVERVGVRAEMLLGDPYELLDTLDRNLKHKREVLNSKTFADSIRRYLSVEEGVDFLTREQLSAMDIEACDMIPDTFYAEYYEELILNAHRVLSDLVVDTDEIVQKQLSKNSKILIEGAHGTLLDLDHGTYPYVTASSPTAAGMLLGAGIAPKYLTRSIGVFKAYQTRVGAGPMPTEIFDGQAELIRLRGHEYGTKTGRPRRVGYFDKVAFRYAMELNGFTDIALTRLDILSGVGDLKVCNQYEYQGKILTRFPTDTAVLAECKPVYTDKDCFIGWDTGKDNINELTSEFIKEGRYITASVGKPSFIGIGEGREDLIVV